jgi:hypothetical protein
MVGNKNSGNPWRIPILFDKEIGEVILEIIRKKGYGNGTYAGKILLEDLKDEIIAIKGPEFYDEWYAKWSMKKDEQSADKRGKLINQYITLGFPMSEAENLANTFPNERPMDVVKQRNNVTSGNGAITIQPSLAPVTQPQSIEGLPDELKQLCSYANASVQSLPICWKIKVYQNDQRKEILSKYPNATEENRGDACIITIPKPKAI